MFVIYVSNSRAFLMNALSMYGPNNNGNLYNNSTNNIRPNFVVRPAKSDLIISDVSISSCRSSFRRRYSLNWTKTSSGHVEVLRRWFFRRVLILKTPDGEDPTTTPIVVSSNGQTLRR